MKPILSGLIAFLLTGLAGHRLQDPPPSAGVEAPPHFAMFADLVGKTWQGAFPGGKLHDTHELTWMFGTKFVRDVHRVTDAAGEVIYEGETIYGWDHETERVRWWYFNATGGQVIGDLVESDGRWAAEGRNHGPQGQIERVRSEIALGEGTWSSTSFALEGGEWKERFTMDFVELR